MTEDATPKNATPDHEGANELERQPPNSELKLRRILSPEAVGRIMTGIEKSSNAGLDLIQYTKSIGGVPTRDREFAEKLNGAIEGLRDIIISTPELLNEIKTLYKILMNIIQAVNASLEEEEQKRLAGKAYSIDLVVKMESINGLIEYELGAVDE